MTRVINFKLTHSAVQTAASGQKQPVAYLRWADCFKLTTVIGTLIKTVAGR